MTLVLQVFLFKEGAFLGTEMATGDRLEIGRDPTCDIVVDDDGASRKHAMLFEAGGQLCVQDLGSANGTKLNGNPISAPSYVSARDDVNIGKHTLKFKVLSGVAPSAPQPVAPGVQPPTVMVDEGAGPAAVDALFGDPTSAAPPPPGAQPLSDLFDGFGSGGEAPAPGMLRTDAGDPDATLVEDFGALAQPPPGQQISNEDKPTAPVAAIRPSADNQLPAAPVPAAASLPGREESTTPDPGRRIPSAETPVQPMAAKPAPSVDTTQPIQPPEPPPAWSGPSGPAPPAAGADLGLPGAPAPGLAAEPPPPAADVTLPPPADGDDGAALPAVSWEPTPDWDDDDDEDEDDNYIPDWSAVQKLVREPSQDAGAKARTVIEVLHFRGETIIDHVVLDEGDEFKFGRSFDKESLKARGLKRPTTLVAHRRNNVAELRCPEGLGGSLFRQGKNVDIAQVPEAQGKKARVPLTEGDMASLELGGDRIYVRFAKEPDYALPPELAGRQKQIRKLHTIAIASAVTMWAVGVAFLWILEYRAHQRRVIQLEDSGFAEVYEEEELELEEPEPEPEEEPIEEELPEEKPPEETPEVEKPKPKVTEVLKNIPKLNDTASSQNLKAALSNIDGIRVPGAAAGFKVSELTGKAPSGNVQIGGAAGGLNTSGLNSVLKKNTGALGAKTKRKVKGRVVKLKRQSKIKGQGTLSREEIQRVIDRNIGQIQVCYERALRKNPSIHGKVQLEWTIKTNGKVGVVKTARSTLGSATAVSCMAKAVKRWRFPKPRGGSVIVNYPFIFNTL